MTCSIGFLVWYWNMLNELKDFRQKDDINPVLILIPVLNILLLYSLPEKVLDAKRMAGVPNPTVQNGIMYVLFSWYFLQNDLNEVWRAAGGQPPAY